MWPALSGLILMGDTQKPEVLAGDHSEEFGFLLGGSHRRVHTSVLNTKERSKSLFLHGLHLPRLSERFQR